VAVTCTDVGRRANNEDVLLARDDLGLYVVCDGIGGNRAGEIAAELAVNVVEAMVEQRLDELHASSSVTPSSLLALARDATLAANRAVHFAGRDSAELAHMGSTLTMVIVAGPFGVMAHVGDSRLYHLRDRKLTQVSRDHTAAQFLRDVGLITDAELVHHPQSNVLTRSLGQSEDVEPDVIELDLRSEDRLMLCSDGVSSYLPNQDWLARLLASEELDDAAEHLVDQALDNGSSDNATAVIIRVRSDNAAQGHAAA
jgi:protein phosphatase